MSMQNKGQSGTNVADIMKFANMFNGGNNMDNNFTGFEEFTNGQKAYGNERRGSYGNENKPNLGQMINMLSMFNNMNQSRPVQNNYNAYKMKNADFSAVKNFIPEEMIDIFNRFT